VLTLINIYKGMGTVKGPLRAVFLFVGRAACRLRRSVSTDGRRPLYAEGSILMPLDRLLQLRIPQRLPEEGAVASAEMVAYDRHGRGRRRIMTDTASPCCHTRETAP
jgi:hypothetical protein